MFLIFNSCCIINIWTIFQRDKTKGITGKKFEFNLVWCGLGFLAIE